MAETAEVVIIGAGIMGASIAYHLALRGCTDVHILEKAPTEVSGSTARSAAGVRHQFSTRTNILLSRYSIERLKHFTEETGGHAELRQVGYLFLIDDPQTWQRSLENVALQRSLGVDVQTLTPQAAGEFIPETNLAGLVGATFCPDDGFVDPHGVAMGYLNRARELGVRLHRERAATGFRIAGERVEAVETAQGPIACETLVLAAGAYSGELATLAGLQLPIKPYRRNIYITDPFPAIPQHIPLTADIGSGFYLRKEGDSVLMGMSNLAEPAGYNLTVDWGWLDTVLEAGLHRFPILERAGLAERQCWAGLYEITPDHLPILGRTPGLQNWINAAGFSGHGISHSPATGMLMAEEILDGRAHSIDIDELRIERFEREPAAEMNVI